MLTVDVMSATAAAINIGFMFISSYLSLMHHSNAARSLSLRLTSAAAAIVQFPINNCKGLPKAGL